MPSWEEIQKYARSKYSLSQDEEQYFALVFGYDNQRSQQVWVRHFSAYDRDFLEFRTPVCKEDEMAPKVALRKNAELAVGALCVEDGLYFLMYSAPLATMDVEEFELPLHAMAACADQLEATFSAANDAF